MQKPLVLTTAALMLSLLTHAQAQSGLAFDYVHIHAPAMLNIGSGSGMGGSVFFYAPLPKDNLGLDISIDIAGGHTTYAYYPFNPSVGGSSTLVSVKRPFVYSALPVHVVYSHSYRQLRLFAGAGLFFSHLSMDEAGGHGWSMGSTCNTIGLSFKAGFQLLQHVVLSGEFRPVSADVSKTDPYQPNSYKISNQVSLKLGYAFGKIQPTKHSSPKHSNS